MCVLTEAEQLKKPLQLVAIDIESAFDSIEPQEAMAKLGYNEEYTEQSMLTTIYGISTSKMKKI